jgi:hypothetical protein
MLKAAITTPLALRGRLRSNGTRYPNRRLYFAALESSTDDTLNFRELPF